MSYSKKRKFGPFVDSMMPYKRARPTAIMLPAVKRTRNRIRGGRRTYVKGAIAPYGGRRELKYTDLTEANYRCTAAGTVTCLNLLQEGDDNTTRDGRQVTIKSVAIRGVLKPEDTLTQDTHARIMLVWDNANNAAAAVPTIAQILANGTTSNTFPLIDNANRFTILWDKSYAVGGVQSTATQAISKSPNVHVVKYYKKLNLVTQYVGTTGLISNIQNGSLLLVTIGDQATSDASVLLAATRVRFIDQ